MELKFSPAANQVLDALDTDAAYDSLVDAIWETLDHIAESPNSATVRRRVLRTQKGHSVWMVQVPNRHRENPWVVLWQVQDGEALIAYIGPEEFGTR